ncbi:LuxR family transcriptional regulator [Sphaerisporangium melleum]|uniref:LuxR family transcriptional regulator n=2 Tax=Sphaerisporangium melleum TaxID=321316 RepID=A0A917R3G3_9ACTN|nr:LuxR family transcriptional regulator [Sphaerisporangium melleum]GII67612.1 LuxR family transcriptional regulator [Sphaerisporangium melleum]
MGQRAGALPCETTSFVGRRRATAEIRDLLTRSRLVTLTGVAGVGKTRLALHVARQMRRSFEDGVRLVELGSVQSPSLVTNAVSAALEPPDTISTRDPVDALAGHLAGRRMLLVLDNCEHVLDACAHLIGRLLAASPGLRVLATSREPLGLPAEHVWQVLPLTTPGPRPGAEEDPGCGYEAVALFEDRAAAASGFTLGQDNEAAVATLCRRLDGLPLAIELAAVRLRALSVDQLLDRLEDRYRLLSTGYRAGCPRHQTLRAAIEWSFELCDEPERTLWARLSVCTGGAGLSAVEDVCAGGALAPGDVTAGLAGLVDKSIVNRDDSGPEARYGMLETIRDYGRERLAGSGEEPAVRRRHRDHYLRLAEEAEADWFGPGQPAWSDRLLADQANVWAALEFSLGTPGEVRTGLRMAAALWWYWMLRAVRDGRRWLDRALALDPEPTPERAKALWVDGWVAIGQGDVEHALRALHESAGLARRLGDDTTLARATQWIGTAMWIQDRLPEAVTHLTRAMEHYRSTGERTSISTVVDCQLGMVVALLGDVRRGVSLCEETVRLCAERGECWTRSWALWNLAVTWWSQGDLRRADKYARESLRVKRRITDRHGIPFCMEFLAWIAMTRGDAAHAALMLGMSDKMWEPIGAPLFAWGTLRGWSVRCREQARERLGEEAFEEQCRRAAAIPFETAVACALGETRRTPAPAGLTDAPAPSLTPREREVARLVAEGRSNKEIAARLVVSQRTAEGHVDRIMHKLGVRSRTRIAAWAAAHTDDPH